MTNKLPSILLLIALLLMCHVASAAAPIGSWWNASYGYRQQILIPAGSSVLPNGYAVQVVLNHAALVTATKSLASGNDVRVAYWNGAAWVELDRVLDADDTWNSASSAVWFKSQAAIAASTTNDNYYVYYGNSSAGTPPQNEMQVFSLFDHFPGNAMDATKWSSSATIGVGASIATVENGEQMRSVTAFPTDTIWETRARMGNASPAAPFYYLAANSNTGGFTFANYLRFRADNTANDAAQLSPSTSTNFTPTGTTTNQLYSFTREGLGGAARFFQNGAVVANYASGAPSGNLVVLLRNEATTNGHDQIYEWIRVRPYRNPEPTLSLSTEEFVYPTPVANYSFEQASWNGTAGEVTDTGPNGLNGRAVNGAVTANATPAVAGATGTCRYASLDGTNDYVSVADNALLDITAQVSFAAWVRHRTNAYKTWEAILTKGDSAYRLHLNGGGGCTITDTLAGNVTNGIDAGLNSGCATADLNSNQVPAAGTWYHVAATHDGNTMKIYLNGTLINQATYNAAIGTNNFELRIGENAEQTGRQWTGDIDEVSVWSSAVSQSVVQAHRTATHACNTIPHFVIQHDGYGVNCAAESITINVRDIANNPYVGYGQQITLDTGSGRGDWSLTTGNGTLNNGTANDGLATYQWSSTDTSATFSLAYREGTASININAYQTSDVTIRDDDLEGSLAWSPSGFTVTSSPLSNPPPGAIPAFASPQTAGTNFTVYLTAFGVTPTDNQCGVIEAYTGAKNLKFWSTYVNPNTGTRNVTINASNIATVEGSSVAQAVTFANGQATVTAAYRDAGLINIAMKDDTTGNPSLPTGIRGSTGNIVVRPSTFVLSNIRRTSDSFANPAAANASGAVFIAAGQAFSATVTAQESGGTATPNFGQESTPESVALNMSLVLPAGGNNPAIASGTGFTAFTNGVATGTDFSWPEVGIITLTPHVRDSDYLGAGDVTGTTTGNVGRFIPYNFGVTQNSPVIAASCPASGFLYLGQPLTYSTAPVLSLTARAFGGTTTQNYSGTFFKLTNASSTGRNYVTSAGTLDQSGLPANDPAVLSLSNGLATLTFNANSGLVYTRSTPVAPFTPTLTLSLNVLDTDGVAYSNSTSTLTNNPLVINSPSIGMPEQRYGRIAFSNAVGSELLNLPLPMHAEYFSSNSAGFMQNAADSCTTGVTNTLTLNLTAGGSSCLLNASTCPGPAGQQFQMPPIAGDFVAILRAPGVGYTGTVTVAADVPTWLRFDWDASTPALENPQGIATFGIFSGRSRRIFQAEQ